MEFLKYTIYSKYVNASISTTTCNYKISSSASLFATKRPADKRQLPALHLTTHLGQLTETGKDTLQKLWEGRSELEMNQTVSNKWFIGLRHWMGHFQNKEGTNAGGVLLPLCFIFYFLH